VATAVYRSRSANGKAAAALHTKSDPHERFESLVSGKAAAALRAESDPHESFESLVSGKAAAALNQTPLEFQEYHRTNPNIKAPLSVLVFPANFADQNTVAA
jgi:hypothetical protein